jgi:uncharacterized protein HemY
VKTTLQLAELCLVAFTAGTLHAQQAPDHVRLGVVATNARDLGMALRHFEAALRQDSMNYEANWRAALTLGLMGDPFPMSVKSARRDSLYDGAYHILGRWNAEIMRLPGISRFFAKHFLGGRVFDQASWSRATAYLEKAVELAPGRIYHHLALADIYLDTKRSRDAEAQLRVVDSLPVREALDTNYRQQAAFLRRRLARD